MLIISLVMLVVLGGVVFFMRDLLFGDVVATYEQAQPEQTEYQDKWLSYEVLGCLGEYCEGKESYGFIPAGHEYYYLIWMADGSVMPLSVSKKADKEYLDELADATWDYIEGTTSSISVEPRTFNGTIKTQETEAFKYYREALSKMGITGIGDAGYHNELLDCTKTKTDYYILFGLITLVPIFGIIVAFTTEGKKSKKQKNQEQTFLPQ